jgi:hypothetical protein
MPKTCIIQYVPDPIRNERFNIGVLSYDDETIQKKYITDWSKLEMYLNRKFDWLKEITEIFVWDHETINSYLTEYQPGSLKLLGPHGTILSVNEALVDAEKRYL